MKLTDWEKFKDEFQLIDVREAFEFKREHLPNSINLPMGKITLTEVQKVCAGKRAIFLCQSGARSRKVFEQFVSDLVDAETLEGGINKCKELAIDLEGSGKGMSLERQVRIAAGSLVLSGILLMKMGVSGAEYLSAFVGAGLIFAGVTDTCGMAILLAKMPWNNK